MILTALRITTLRENIPRIEAGDKGSDGEDPFGGLDDDDEDVDFAKFIEPEEH